MHRSARPEDAKAVATVYIESRRKFVPFAPLAHSDAEIRSWTRNTLIPSGGVAVYETLGQIVAFIATSDIGGVSWIDHLYTLPGWTGKGIGLELLRHAENTIVKSISLYTFQQNTGARRFYERHHYKPIKFSDGCDNEENCPDILYKLFRRETEA